uniref:Reverse transcriptase domain-containing protein n=1 Tax=Tanacetum cinerariifolium TaxID=118510 RepID=A0A699RDV7_TANCI|nr:hypothetical protein [Tanacetum cinerariifolium]
MNLFMRNEKDIKISCVRVPIMALLNCTSWALLQCPQPSISRFLECCCRQAHTCSQSATSAVTTAMTAMLKQFQSNPPPAQVKPVEEIYVTCGGDHPYYQCLAAGGNTFLEYRDNIQGYVSAAARNFNQGNPGYRPQGVANQMRPPGFA